MNTNRTQEDYNLYPADIYQKLEFDKVIEKVEDLCTSVLGKRLLHILRFMTKVEEIQKQLLQVNEFKQILELEDKQFPGGVYFDLKDELGFLRIQNSTLSEEQIFRVFKVLREVNAILYFFKNNDGEHKLLFPTLYHLVKSVFVDKDLLNEIKTVMDNEGKIRSSASKELTAIRRQMTYKYREVDTKFKEVIVRLKKLNWLSDEVESVRNGRRVLAIPSEYKRKIKGIVHDESNTGRTTFIEPEETLIVSNELTELQHEERRAIHRILKALTDAIRPYREEIFNYQKVLALFDFIRAKALFAIKVNGVLPQVVNEKVLELNNAVHPLLYLVNKGQGKKTIPLSLRLSIADRLLIISGPNAGGKSVSLKTVGLLQLMLQCGFLIPVEPVSVLGVFDQLFIDIGDEQSLENDLSTYSSRLLNMKHFDLHANNKTLVLIDEFGSGTDPKFGGAIAEAILEKLNKSHSFGVITTHYSNIKIVASETKGIINGTMAFDPQKLKPLYQLEVGKPGSSFAFEIAEKCGLGSRILESAREKVGQEYKEFDKLLSTLQQEKADLVERSEEVKKLERSYKNLYAEYELKSKELKKRKRQIILDAEEQAMKLLGDTNKEMENMVRAWREDQENEELRKRVKQKLDAERKEKKAVVEKLRDQLFDREPEGKLEVGAFVQIRDSQRSGTVLELRKSHALVEFGMLKTKVKLKDLVVVKQTPPSHYKKVEVKYDSFQAQVEFTNNIDVRGLRKDEALQKVEELLDKALIVNADHLKILHGRGDGILKKSIRSYLKGFASVKSISDEDPQYGGDSFSIVELK